MIRPISSGEPVYVEAGLGFTEHLVMLDNRAQAAAATEITRRLQMNSSDAAKKTLLKGDAIPTKARLLDLFHYPDLGDPDGPTFPVNSWRKGWYDAKTRELYVCVGTWEGEVPSQVTATWYKMAGFELPTASRRDDFGPH